MNFPPFPRYKPSGVEWLGDVPEHWEVKRLKQRFRIVNGGTPASSEESYWEGEIRWFTPEDLGRNPHDFIEESRRQISKEGLANCSARLSQAGSILLSTRAPIGHVALMRNDGCCNQGCRILEPCIDRAHGPFAVYAIISSREILKAAGTGSTFLELSGGDLGDHWMPSPPISEQRAIADFLDERTGKLDALAEKKRGLIEKLKEKRSALISRTVTKGLPAEAAAQAGLPTHPKLKPSGIDWLGGIPSDWIATKVWVQRVSGHVELQDGNHGELHPKAEDYVDLGIPFVMANDLDSGKIDFERCHYIEKEMADSLRIGFSKEGDVLLTHKGTIGRVGVVQKSEFPYVMLTPQVTYYRCRKKILNRFLRWEFESRFWLEQMELVGGLGSTRAYVGLLDQKMLYLLLPSLTEQEHIADYLDRETAKIDRMIEKVKAAIEKLAEYRTALITAAVTGKIDVRAVTI